MADFYLHRILPHIKNTFSGVEWQLSANHRLAQVENLNKNFSLIIEDIKMDPNDSFGFVKLKVPIPLPANSHLTYEQLVHFVATMNHCHRGCHWTVDTLHHESNEIYLYSTLITELGRRADDKDQIVMEILNLQKMKYHTDQYLADFANDPFWAKSFMTHFHHTVIPCIAPENFNNSKNEALLERFLARALQLKYNITAVNSNTFKVVTTKGHIAILTFLGEELLSIYSVVTESSPHQSQLSKVLNEYNQESFLGHYECSPVKHMVCYTNYMRLAEGLRDIKIQLFLDSPDFAEIYYFDQKELAA